MCAMLTAGLRCSTEKVYGKCKHHQVQLDSPCQDRAITFIKQSNGHTCVVSTTCFQKHRTFAFGADYLPAGSLPDF